jgi:hypothetical protein
MMRATIPMIQDMFNALQVAFGWIVQKLRQETDADTQVWPGACGEPIEAPNGALVRFDYVRFVLGSHPIVWNRVDYESRTIWRFDRVAVCKIEIVQHGLNFGSLGDGHT